MCRFRVRQPHKAKPAQITTPFSPGDAIDQRIQAPLRRWNMHNRQPSTKWRSKPKGTTPNNNQRPKNWPPSSPSGQKRPVMRRNLEHRSTKPRRVMTTPRLDKANFLAYHRHRRHDDPSSYDKVAQIGRRVQSVAVPTNNYSRRTACPVRLHINRESPWTPSKYPSARAHLFASDMPFPNPQSAS